MELELPQLLVPDLPSNKQVNLTWSSITLGHKMSLARGYIWQMVNLTQRWSSSIVSHLATRCLCLGVHLPTGQPDQSSNTLGHQMPLLGGQIDILWDSWSASQPTSHVQKCQLVRFWVSHIVSGGRTGAWPHRAPVQGPSTPTGSPWGSDLPDQGQASDTNELSSPLYTVCTTYRDCLHFCIYTT